VKYIVVLIVFGLLLSNSCEKEKPVLHPVDHNPYYRFMWYNVENLFDTLNNPDKQDDDFTPDGECHWNTERYIDKLNKINRVIHAVGGDSLPVLIGLAEVENRLVLEDLLSKTTLNGRGYRIVHHESPDYRGIDVALLYRSPFFRLLSTKFYPIWFPFDTTVRTREILYVKGVLGDLDTLHIFLNHWPSRSGGEFHSRPRRIFVAEFLKSRTDSIFRADSQARVVITGDFNDEPQDLSIVSGLHAGLQFDNPQPAVLYDLTGYLETVTSTGSYKYKGDWNFLDQFIVSGTLLDTLRPVYSRVTDHQVYQSYFLMERDESYLGSKPYRTYLGSYYHGGYSDHLPVFLNLRYHEHEE